MDERYWKNGYRYDASQWPRRRELEAIRETRDLTPDETNELRWLIFSHTNFLLDKQKNTHT